MTTAPPPAAPPPSPPPLDPPAWQPPPPPPPGPPARPQLRRSRTDKILGGVSGGLAEYTGIDALLWRVGFVALALAGGTGVIVYLLLWLLMPAGPTYYGVPAEPRVKVPAGPRSPVPGLTIAALLIVVGALALITRFGGWDPGPRGFLGAALLVVGLGLVAAAFSGGRTARGGLIALGIVLSLALAAASTLPWDGIRGVHDLKGGIGDRTFRPVSADQVRGVYQGGAGDMTLDLTGVDVSNLAGPITTTIEHGVGDVQVRVPPGADVRLTVMSGIGSIDAFGQGSLDSGFFPGSGTGSWIDDNKPELVIAVHNGAGDVEVSRG
jgi:phage shock protein PspC (stress-responsive transcriptional regulator)